MAKTVLVTGGNSGIGFALSKLLATEHGCAVLLGSRDEKKGSDAVAAIKKLGGKSVELVVIDVASDASVAAGTAVTVLTYLHGVRESVNAIAEIQAAGHDVDLIELRSLKPLDLETIKTSLARTHKLAILDESTQTGGVGASISALVNEELYDYLDAPVKRLCMDDAPVPYAASMEQAVVKRGSDLIVAVKELVEYI
mmetsp:Transcript_34847/g.107860  ORF Transcript_34847/g.107860 Transcript_34847/m.107860 type:complete len:197 (+) Transcript_34847:143-733(+)